MIYEKKKETRTRLVISFISSPLLPMYDVCICACICLYIFFIYSQEGIAETSITNVCLSNY